MTTIKKIQKVFDGADRSMAWMPFEYTDHHQTTGWWYNIFYICPDDKIVEMEISHLHGKRSYPGTTSYQQLESAWITPLHSSMYFNFWYDNYHYHYDDEVRSSWIRYFFTTTTSYTTARVFWPSSYAPSASYDGPQIFVGSQKLKLLPGDKLAAIVKSNVQWGTSAYTFDSFENYFTYDAIVYEEDFAGNVTNLTVGDVVYGYNALNSTVGAIYAVGDLTQKYPAGTNIKIANVTAGGDSLLRTVNSSSYLSQSIPNSSQSVNLTEIKFDGVIPPPTIYRDYYHSHELANVVSVQQAGDNIRYLTDHSLSYYDIPIGGTIQFLTRLDEFRSTHSAVVKSYGTNSVTTNDLFIYPAYPLSGVTVDRA